MNEKKKFDPEDRRIDLIEECNELISIFVASILTATK